MQVRSTTAMSTYRIAGNFRGVLIFVIFVTIPRVTKFSTHEFFHPRIFSRLLTSFAYRASGVTKFKTTKIYSEDPRQLFTKICTPENYPLYGRCQSSRFRRDSTAFLGYSSRCPAFTRFVTLYAATHLYHVYTALSMA